jgi:hypothetical protein
MHLELADNLLVLLDVLGLVMVGARDLHALLPLGKLGLLPLHECSLLLQLGILVLHECQLVLFPHIVVVPHRNVPLTIEGREGIVGVPFPVGLGVPSIKEDWVVGIRRKGIQQLEGSVVILEGSKNQVDGIEECEEVAHSFTKQEEPLSGTGECEPLLSEGLHGLAKSMGVSSLHCLVCLSDLFSVLDVQLVCAFDLRAVGMVDFEIERVVNLQVLLILDAFKIDNPSLGTRSRRRRLHERTTNR